MQWHSIGWLLERPRWRQFKHICVRHATSRAKARVDPRPGMDDCGTSTFTLSAPRSKAGARATADGSIVLNAHSPFTSPIPSSAPVAGPSPVSVQMWQG